MESKEDSFRALEKLILKNSTDAEDLNELESLINQVKTTNRINYRVVTFDLQDKFEGYQSVDVGTLLHLAASIGNGNAVKLLLKAGVSFSLKARRQITVLHVAAFKGHSAMVTALLAAGADVNAKDQVRVSLAIAGYIYLSYISTLTDLCDCELTGMCDDRMARPLL